MDISPQILNLHDNLSKIAFLKASLIYFICKYRILRVILKNITV